VPFQPIPTSGISFGIAGTPPAPRSGQTIAATWPVGVINPPKPGERWDLSSFYLPVAGDALGSTTPPAAWNITVRLMLSGVVCFQQQSVVDFFDVAPSPWVGANLSADLSISNPVAMRAGQTLAVGFSCSYDQDTTAVNILLGGEFEDPTVTGNAVPILGSIGYAITAEPFILTP
jgi:hypothetical protein